MQPERYLNKYVAMMVEVPICEYCWGPPSSTSSMHVCPHFDNPGGHSQCELGFSPVMYSNKAGVFKPKECLELKPYKEVLSQTGFYRTDGDGHGYVVPEVEIGGFDTLLNQIDDCLDEDLIYKLYDTFNAIYDKYRVEGELSKMRIIMDT